MQTHSFDLLRRSQVYPKLAALKKGSSIEMEMETAAIEKRYEREISMAEGNRFKTKRLEQQKQKEVAQVKNEAFVTSTP